MGIFTQPQLVSLPDFWTINICIVWIYPAASKSGKFEGWKDEKVATQRLFIFTPGPWEDDPNWLHPQKLT